MTGRPWCVLVADVSQQTLDWALAVRFTSGKYEGLTLREVLYAGEPGAKYVTWAADHWLTEPVRLAANIVVAALRDRELSEKRRAA